MTDNCTANIGQRQWPAEAPAYRRGMPRARTRGYWIVSVVEPNVTCESGSALFRPVT